MGKNICEKIISEHAGKSVSAGDIVTVKVDYCFTHDASGPLVINYLKELGKPPFNPKRCIIFIDHVVPSHKAEISNEQAKLRRFAQENGLIFYEAGNGVCHQLMVENFASPGELIIGGDSHTCTIGAIGAFATGMGATDVAVAMALGKTWLRVPETIRVIVNGQLKKGVFAKDLILYVINKLGVEGANYKALEFQGSTIENMDIHERLTLTNMAVEAGAKTGLVFSDEKTKRYLEAMGRGDKFRVIQSDPDANYESTIEINASDLKPLIALPYSVDNVKPVDEVGNIKIDEVYIGSCTNARLEDLRIVAKIIKGKELKARLIVTPASKRIYLEALKEGLINIFLEAGGMFTPPGCGLCFGAYGGIPADGENILATTNRNFIGRTGNPNAPTYLCSPATAAASAVEGRIADPRDYL